MSKNNQYFMYGILISYQKYLDIKTILSIDDVLKGNDGIKGIFTGRNGDFMIIGKVLETLDVDDKEPLVVPELSANDERVIKNLVKEKYGLDGWFHYYFIRN